MVVARAAPEFVVPAEAIDGVVACMTIEPVDAWRTLDRVVAVPQVLVADGGAQEGIAAGVILSQRSLPGQVQIEAARGVARRRSEVDLERLDPAGVIGHVLDVQHPQQAACGISHQDGEV